VSGIPGFFFFLRSEAFNFTTFRSPWIFVEKVSEKETLAFPQKTGWQFLGITAKIVLVSTGTSSAATHAHPAQTAANGTITNISVSEFCPVASSLYFANGYPLTLKLSSLYGALREAYATGVSLNEPFRATLKEAKLMVYHETGAADAKGWFPAETSTCLPGVGQSTVVEQGKEVEVTTTVCCFPLVSSNTKQAKLRVALFAPIAKSDVWAERTPYIVGVVVGIILLALFVILFAIWAAYKFRREKKEKEAKDLVYKYLMDRREGKGQSLRKRLLLTADEIITPEWVLDRLAANATKAKVLVGTLGRAGSFTGGRGSFMVSSTVPWVYRPHELAFLEGLRQLSRALGDYPLSATFQASPDKDARIRKVMGTLETEKARLRASLPTANGAGPRRWPSTTNVSGPPAATPK